MLIIEPTGAVLGAIARGIDLAQPLRERDMGTILLALGRMASCASLISISVLAT